MQTETSSSTAQSEVQSHCAERCSPSKDSDSSSSSAIKVSVLPSRVQGGDQTEPEVAVIDRGYHNLAYEGEMIYD